MLKKYISGILILAALAVIVSAAGCTAPAQENKDILNGKDVFDPSKFSMAVYSIVLDGSQNAGTFTVLSYPGEDHGNRLTSVEVSGNSSRRMDVWLNRSGEGVNRGMITVIDSSGMQMVDTTNEINMTTIDGTWNTPGSRYTYYCQDTATVPAGVYENCSVYYGIKTIRFNESTTDLTVLFYLHPSSPVPVLFMVKTPDGVAAYALNGVYGPGDVNGSPERAIQSYFDRIGSGDYLKASRLLVKTEGSSFKPMDRGSITEMENNMAQTYGRSGEKMAIQYVITDSITPMGIIGGHEAVAAHWISIQYSRTPGEIYIIDGTFDMVNDGGWKIIV
jgi:hypothetical protein